MLINADWESRCDGDKCLKTSFDTSIDKAREIPGQNCAIKPAGDVGDRE